MAKKDKKKSWWNKLTTGLSYVVGAAVGAITFIPNACVVAGTGIKLIAETFEDSGVWAGIATTVGLAVLGIPLLAIGASQMSIGITHGTAVACQSGLKEGIAAGAGLILEFDSQIGTEEAARWIQQTSASYYSLEREKKQVPEEPAAAQPQREPQESAQDRRVKATKDQYSALQAAALSEQQEQQENPGVRGLRARQGQGGKQSGVKGHGATSTTPTLTSKERPSIRGKKF